MKDVPIQLGLSATTQKKERTNLLQGKMKPIRTRTSQTAPFPLSWYEDELGQSRLLSTSSIFWKRPDASRFEYQEGIACRFQ